MLAYFIIIGYYAVIIHSHVLTTELSITQFKIINLNRKKIPEYWSEFNRQNMLRFRELEREVTVPCYPTLKLRLVP